ncbi:brain acid soluble protein 1-like isoform X1 [Triticum dicoccoides]|uniref:brain acid soluble protein 1-like isoform X1 n=1 Tax=Triticum dicoccoides TaxID=85692 RepID=UPI0008454603|nr:brain acid soluble protein 1-like isoform X1 [Triticum dicoccoides]XP_044409931.1 brain acid soluble protein 1-like isoform X1 [Triticum aestivum]
MGNCGLKPKALGDDDAPPPAEPPTAPATGAEQEVALPAVVEEAQAPAEEASRDVVAGQQSETATGTSSSLFASRSICVPAPGCLEGTSAAAETKEQDEPKATAGTEPPKEKETVAAEEAAAAAELPASTPATVA